MITQNDVPGKWRRKIDVGASGCWVWMGKRSRRYGLAYQNRSSWRCAHRAVYEATIGPVPEGLELDHLCRNRFCVNPAHLEPVTHRENVRRGEAGKYLSMRDVCRNGHPFDKENTFLRSDGSGRGCKTCRRVAGLKYHHANREARNAQCMERYHRKKALRVE